MFKLDDLKDKKLKIGGLRDINQNGMVRRLLAKFNLFEPNIRLMGGLIDFF